MTEPSVRRAWRAAAAAAVAALVLALVTLAVFERAYPLVDVGLRLSREEAIARARALAAADGLAPAGARAAARFANDQGLATYVDLAAGGPDSVRALAQGREVALYAWDVRLFGPGVTREAWLLRRSAVMLPIPGTSRVAHLEENMGAALLELSEQEFEDLSRARAA